MRETVYAKILGIFELFIHVSRMKDLLLRQLGKFEIMDFSHWSFERACVRTYVMYGRYHFAFHKKSKDKFDMQPFAICGW